MQRKRRAVGLQTASGPVGHSAPVFPAPAQSEFRRVIIASLNLADYPKDGAIAERLAVQGCRHIREESRAVVRGQWRGGAHNLFELGVG